MRFSSRSEINERKQQAELTQRPQGQRDSWISAVSNIVSQQAPHLPVPEHNVPATEHDVPVPGDNILAPGEPMDAQPPQPSDEPPASDEETPGAAQQSYDAPIPDDHEDDEWRPGSTQVPESWDMLIGTAARGRNEAVQASHMIDVSVLPEEGYNIDRHDIRRRCVFLYHNRELLEDIQRTDGAWPFPLGRMVDEPLDIVVEFTYRVPERQDDPFVHPAATPPRAGGTLPTPRTSAPRPLAMIHMSLGGNDNELVVAPPDMTSAMTCHIRSTNT